MKLTKAEARKYILRHQCLDKPKSLEGKAGALDFVRRVGCVQFDPLDQVGCNPHLVLQSRVQGYKPAMLDALLYEDRLLVDGFDKNLSIWPVEDWPAFARNRGDARIWFSNDAIEGPLRSAMDHVLAEIAVRGPLCSADFETREKVNWPWGPTNAVRAALESLYFRGGLAIHHKVGSRKYYDHIERCLPQTLLSAPEPHPAAGDYIRWRVLRRVGAIGLLWNRGGDAWLGIPALKSADRAEAFAALESGGELTRMEVEGVDNPCFVRSRDLPELEQSLQSEVIEPKMSFIAPLDNLIWDRKLIRSLFGFEYTWEVYTPAPKRKYGYYVLPVLYGDRFVARVEPKYHKKEKTLELLNWWWEDGVKPDREMKKAFRGCVKEFMGYLGAKEIQYGGGYTGLKI